MSIDKTDPIKEDSEDSMGSSPEGEEAPPTNSNNNNAQETQPPKRKGGRKPVRDSPLASRHFVSSLSGYSFPTFFSHAPRPWPPSSRTCLPGPTSLPAYPPQSN